MNVFLSWTGKGVTADDDDDDHGRLQICSIRPQPCIFIGTAVRFASASLKFVFVW